VNSAFRILNGYSELAAKMARLGKPSRSSAAIAKLKALGKPHRSPARRALGNCAVASARGSENRFTLQIASEGEPSILLRAGRQRVRRFAGRLSIPSAFRIDDGVAIGTHAVVPLHRATRASVPRIILRPARRQLFRQATISHSEIRGMLSVIRHRIQENFSRVCRAAAGGQKGIGSRRADDRKFRSAEVTCSRLCPPLLGLPAKWCAGRSKGRHVVGPNDAHALRVSTAIVAVARKHLAGGGSGRGGRSDEIFSSPSPSPMEGPARGKQSLRIFRGKRIPRRVEPAIASMTRVTASSSGTMPCGAFHEGGYDSGVGFRVAETCGLFLRFSLAQVVSMFRCGTPTIWQCSPR